MRMPRWVSTTEKRFLHEAKITARLQHPGVVPIYEAGRWPDGTPYYVMKLVQGRTLREVIRDCKTFDERLALVPKLIAVAERGKEELKPVTVLPA